MTTPLQEPVAEDPEVVARRKAFLMSSTPEILRNRVEAVQVPSYNTRYCTLILAQGLICFT